MAVNGTGAGAATDAMQKAMEMPHILLDLVRNSAPVGNQPLATGGPAPSPN